MPQDNIPDRIAIIDTFGFFFRSFYALPPLKSPNGFPTGLLTGFVNFISNLGKEFDTSYIVFALDSPGKSFRNSIYPNYKANRDEAPQDLKVQIPIAIEWIQKMGFATMAKAGYEADDIIATIAHLAQQKGLKVTIISHDKDLNQLINDDITLFDPIKKVPFDAAACKEKFGIAPHQFTDYQAIVGDSSDNIPGVKGLGAKGAMKLLSTFGDLDDIYANIDLVTPPRTGKLLQEGKDMAFVSKELVTLKQDVFEDIVWRSYAYPPTNPILKLEDELHQYGLHQILSKVKTQGLYIKTNEPQPSDQSFTPTLITDPKTLMQTISQIKPQDLVAFDTETDGLDTQNANLVGFSFCFDPHEAYYVPIAHKSLEPIAQINPQDALSALEALFAHAMIGHNLKFDFQIVARFFELQGKTLQPPTIKADTLIMAWLINPASQKSLDVLTKAHLGYDMMPFKEVVPKPTKHTFADVALDKACLYASEDAWATWKLYDKLLPLVDKPLSQLAFDVEYPFVHTLMAMEQKGIKVDVAFLEAFEQETSAKIKTLTAQIHEYTGEAFNLNSPKQLGVILFEKLGLEPPKKTKTGYSTDEKTLNKLKSTYPDQPVLDALLDYREVHKLQSTYIHPLIELGKASPTSTIHTNFLQTGTATGRLSSNNPNLQNIPVRHDLGRKIRQGFVAKEGCQLIGIDYSQIELRLLADLSEDESLLKAFREEADIHLQTAIKLFGEEEAVQKRPIAKSINFGILYGMGSRKLSEMLGIPTKDAKSYIESYFDLFPKVRGCIDGIKAHLEEKGYIETFLGRRRYFDFENATAFEQSNNLRMGVNAVFQGSAADLIKLSMNAIAQKYQNTPQVDLLLQIHDEVLIQAPSGVADEVAKTCVEIMESIDQSPFSPRGLKVPLGTSVHIGSNWGELK